MGKKIIASIGAVLLVTLAAVGAFASQDGVQTQGEEPTVTDTSTPTEEATATPTEENTPTPTDTAEPDATDTPEATPTPGDDDGDGDDDDVHGIPDGNPAKQPNDDDVCEKGETDIKTTPSGNMVTVPCHAADKDHEEKQKHRGGDDGDSDDEEEDDEDDAEG